jgi:hypothetical protein
MDTNNTPNNFSQNTSPQALGKKGKKEKSLTRLVVCLLIAIFSFVALMGVQSYILRNKQTTPIVVCSVDEIPMNTVLTKENIAKYFTVIERDSFQTTKKNYSSLSDIPEGILADDMCKNQELLKTNIRDNKEVLGYLDGSEVMEMSIKVADIGDVVGGMLRGGDLVNISYVDSKTNESTLLYSKVYVKQALNSSGETVSRNNTSASATTIILLVNPAMEEEIYAAISNGDVKLSRFSFEYN